MASKFALKSLKGLAEGKNAAIASDHRYTTCTFRVNAGLLKLVVSQGLHYETFYSSNCCWIVIS